MFQARMEEEAFPLVFSLLTFVLHRPSLTALDFSLTHPIHGAAS